VTTSDDVQAAVDSLTAALGQAVLIEDQDQRPMWWCTKGPVDPTRMRTILHREVKPSAAAVVPQFKLRRATGPVRTPAVPEAEMWARWAVPVRHQGHFLGLLWILDPQESLRESDLQPALDCADLAGAVLAQRRSSAESTRLLREQLIDRLLDGPDDEAVRELARLELIPHDALVQVEVPAVTGGWMLPCDMSAHVVNRGARTATSGAPLPLVCLGEAVRRAGATRRAIAAGAQPDPPTWDGLGAWHLVVAAPEDLSTESIHPAAAVLGAQSRGDLLATARAIVDNGGDVAAAASQLHVHRTTLYYRVERIKELTGVDLQDGRTRTNLQFALWLAAYRAQSAAPAGP
jgi:hypothetical protein